MFTIILRRIQRILLPIKILVVLGCVLGGVWLVINTAPSIGLILLFCFLLFAFLSLLLSFRFSANLSLLTALAISFVLFLRAVDLLTLFNLILLALFLLLLGLYLRKK